MTEPLPEPPVVVNPRDWPAHLDAPGRTDAYQLPIYRQRVASYLRRRCAAVRASYLVVSCDIPARELDRVLSYPLFVRLPGGDVRLVESRDAENIRSFQRLVRDAIADGLCKEQKLIHALQLPDNIAEAVFKGSQFVRYMGDGTIELRQESPCPE